MTERTVLDLKLDRSFRMLDTDGDGRIREQDLVSLARTLGTAFPGGAPAAVARLERAFAVLWRTDLRPMDTDGDSAISREEWSTGVRRAVARDRTGFLGRMSTMLQAWLDLCDRDGDGRIDRREFTMMYGRTLGLSARALAEAFTTLDIDGDGYLDRGEVYAAVEEYYTSETRDTPGNWLFGPL
ncbi:EF-hand domain-containing protein [Streptomyces sp. NPDC000594]|uniref:EF-hand domain-containing protein n=1 Tax=Streptomyces sp. NPDC000594 TaxID=3154261 RepID=UPI00331CACB8